MRSFLGLNCAPKFGCPSRDVARKMSEGHSKLEAIRCVKRYIARELYYDIIAQNRMLKTA